MKEPTGALGARVYHTLDALRGVGAIGVVVFHMSGAFTPFSMPSGYLAVDLFFMMSGVVLSHAYEIRFEAGMSTVGFMRARLIRLYPLYLLGAVFGLTVTVASLLGRNSQHWDLSSLLAAALLALLILPDLIASPVNEMFPLNIPSWSLFFELLVNLLFVICWPLLTSRRLLAISALTGAAVTLAILHFGSIDQGSTTSSFAVGAARTAFGFCVGILIARRIRPRPRAVSNASVLAIVSVVGIALSGSPTGKARVVWDTACVLLIFPLLVWRSTQVDPGPRVRRVATLLGVTFYAVYILHSPLASVLNSASRHLAAGAGAPYTGIAVLLLLLAGCWLVDSYFDVTIRRYLAHRIPGARSLRAS